MYNSISKTPNFHCDWTGLGAGGWEEKMNILSLLYITHFHIVTKLSQLPFNFPLNFSAKKWGVWTDHSKTVPATHSTCLKISAFVPGSPGQFVREHDTSNDQPLNRFKTNYKIGKLFD